MRLIRKLALQKQKHTKRKKKVLFRPPRGPGAPLPAAAVRFSGHTIVDKSELSCCRAGPGRVGDWRRGEPPGEYSARSPSGPSTPLRSCGCVARAGWGLASWALWFLSFALSLSPCGQKVEDSAPAGTPRTAEGRRAARGHFSNLWLPGEGGRRPCEPPGSAGKVAWNRSGALALIFVIRSIDVSFLLGVEGRDSLLLW